MRRVLLVSLIAALAAQAVGPARAERRAPRCLGHAATIVGTSGGDTIRGTASDDVIVGGGGGDLVRSLRGDDLVCAGGSRDRVVGGRGDDVLAGERGGDVVHGEEGRDDLLGGQGDDRLRGGGRRDHLFGGRGPDLLAGGGGSDVLLPGAGDDRVRGGRIGRARGSVSGDVVWFPFAGGVQVDLSAGSASGEGSDSIVGVEVVRGSPRADVIVGDARPNRLHGELGDDVIDGGASWDVVSGDLGDDALDGGSGADRVRFRGPAGVVVDLAAGSATGQGTDTLSSFRHVFGSDLSDRLVGDGGPNGLSGWLGDDRMYGRAGNDRLFGDRGDDLAQGGAGDDECEIDRGDCERFVPLPFYVPMVVATHPRPGQVASPAEFTRVGGMVLQGGIGVRIVEAHVAIRRVTEGGCRWWNRASFRAAPCAVQRWFEAERHSRERWTEVLGGALPPGRYDLFSRGTFDDGGSTVVVETPFTVR